MKQNQHTQHYFKVAAIKQKFEAKTQSIAQVKNKIKKECYELG